MSHAYKEKFVKVDNLLMVGRSDHFDDEVDFMDEETDKSLIIRKIAGYIFKIGTS